MQQHIYYTKYALRIDVSAIYDGKTTSFAHSVRYDLPDNKLIAIG